MFNDGVTTIKPGHQTTGNVRMIWSDEWSFTLHQEEFTFGEHPRKPTVPMTGFNSEAWGRFCDGFGSSIMVQHFVGPIITFHGQITAKEYMDRLGNQVHPMRQTLFSNSNAVFQDDSDPIHTV
jgi:hypothetical protein